MVNKKKELREKIWKNAVLVILVLTTIGFLIPGFLQGQDQANGQNNQEIRFCSSDSECYIECDNELKSSLCYQNICELNSCEIESQFKFNPLRSPLNFEIIIDENKIDLLERFNQGVPGTFFFKVDEMGEWISAEKLPLNYILEKLDMIIDQTSCLSIRNGEEIEQICNFGEKRLSLTINGEETSLFGDILIKPEDDVLLNYG
jgi:hypothetical protein